MFDWWSGSSSAGQPGDHTHLQAGQPGDRLHIRSSATNSNQAGQPGDRPHIRSSSTIPDRAGQPGDRLTFIIATAANQTKAAFGRYSAKFLQESKKPPVKLFLHKWGKKVIEIFIHFLCSSSEPFYYTNSFYMGFSLSVWWCPCQVVWTVCHATPWPPDTVSQQVPRGLDQLNIEYFKV